MNYSRSKVILKKINALHDSAEAFESHMSKMEKDLLMHYLRELYELILESKDPAVNTTAQVNVKKIPEVDVPEAQAAPKSADNPSSQQLMQESKVSATVVNGNGQLSEVIETKEFQVANEEALKLYDPVLTNLFESSLKSDMSSKFNQLPIADIAKSMGINDRILTINELFNGDQIAFNECTRHLNSLSNFDDAREFLISGVAKNNDWANPIKKSKAEVFIKLIRRRYL